MNPLIEASVVRIKPDQWSLGSLYTCEIVVDLPSDDVIHWEALGYTYCIRKSSAHQGSSIATGDSHSDLFHHAGTSSAVWKIGNTFIKVKAWRPHMQLESDTIQFVNSISSIPTPEILYSWVDVGWNRSFLVVKALEGHTLDQLWTSLPADRCTQIARTVAQFCKTLATATSDTLMTASGNGVLEPFLTAPTPDLEPSWKPHTLGPFSANQLWSYLDRPRILERDMALFNFYHADLGPSNIIVADDGGIVGVIDWESAGFYPTFWLGTKPLVSPGFFLHTMEREAWAVLLASALAKEGLSSDMQKYRAWKKAIGK